MTAPRAILVKKAPNLSAQTATILTEEIISGRFPPGHRLIEADISAEMGVSRATLREALSALAQEGLIRQRQGRGSYVASPSPDELADMAAFRALLEGAAARALTVAKPRDCLQQLVRLTQQLEQDLERKSLRPFQRNLWQYHHTLMQGAQNAFALRSWLSMSNLFRLYIGKIERDGINAPVVLSHLRAFNALIAAEDPTLSELVVRSTIVWMSYDFAGRLIDRRSGALITHLILPDGSITEYRPGQSPLRFQSDSTNS